MSELVGDCVHAKVLGTGNYGRAYHKGKKVAAHRLSYCQHHGIDLRSIDGLVVRHICDNPPCINPDHLLIGTVADNNRDAKERNRLHKWNGARKGEGNPRSKLTLPDIDVIRKRYIKGSLLHGAIPIAKDYNVARRTILDVISGRSWK